MKLCKLTELREINIQYGQFRNGMVRYDSLTGQESEMRSRAAGHN